MREARVRAEETLDDVSANLAEVLRRADALLAEWSAFGAAVRMQVEREAATVGDAVANAVDGAVSRGVSTSLERAVPEQLGARMAGLTAELAKLEHRARTAAKSISDDRVHDRRLLGGLVIGVLVANALLVLLLLRTSHTQAPAPEATRVIEPSRAPSPQSVEGPASASGTAVPPEPNTPAQGSAAPRATVPNGTSGATPTTEPLRTPGATGTAPGSPAARGAEAPAGGASTTAAPRGAATRSNLPARKR